MSRDLALAAIDDYYQKPFEAELAGRISYKTEQFAQAKRPATILPMILFPICRIWVYLQCLPQPTQRCGPFLVARGLREMTFQR